MDTLPMSNSICPSHVKSIFMLEAVKAFFSDGLFNAEEKQEQKHALELATAALLLEVGYADFEIQDEELKIIATALKQNFKFSEQEIQSLIEAALKQHESNESLHPFVHIVNNNFSASEKVRVIETMWQVAYADRRLDKYEEHRIRKIADLLYVPHRDFIRTKLAVQEQLNKT